VKAISKKRDAIIRATIELSAEKGINGATTVLIAERAQTAEVTIFRQFKTKEALLHTIFDEQIENMQKFLFLDHDETLPIKDRFIDFTTKILRYFLDKALELSFLEQYIHTPIGWARRPDMLYRDGENFADYPLIDLVSEGVKQKAIKNLSMPALTGMVIGPLGAFARECHLKGLESDEQSINDVVLACWDGVEA
jgi:AcrR family transcriptional regulator